MMKIKIKKMIKMRIKIRRRTRGKRSYPFELFCLPSCPGVICHSG